MPLIALALQLANFVPAIAGLIGGSKAQDVAAKVVDVAKAITGTASGDAALAAIQANPDTALKFQEAMFAHHETMAKIQIDEDLAVIAAQAQNASDVNKTMQAESAAEHWPTYSWRPFIGFVFGVALLVCVIVAAILYIGVMAGFTKPETLAQLPQFLTAMATLLAIPMPILGIASFFRGKMQADPAIPTDNKG